MAPVTEYSITPADAERLQRSYSYHPTQGDQSIRYTFLRLAARAYAEAILTYCPPSRERAVALTELEGVSMWAVAGVARNED